MHEPVSTKSKYSKAKAFSPGGLITHLDTGDMGSSHMKALQHLQQVQHGFSAPAHQLHPSQHQLPLSYLPTTPLQQAAERQLRHLAQVLMQAMLYCCGCSSLAVPPICSVSHAGLVCTHLQTVKLHSGGACFSPGKGYRIHVCMNCAVKQLVSKLACGMTLLVQLW